MTGNPAQPNTLLFVAKRSHAAFVSGRAHRIGSSWIMLLIALMVLGIAGVIGYPFARGVIAYDRVLNDGISAEATVTDMRTTSGSRGNINYFVTYTYSVDGQVIEREQRVGRDVFERMSRGDEITVAYLVQDPANALLSGSYADSVQRNQDLVFLIIVAGVALIICVVLYNADAHNRRLSREGVFIDGTLVNANGKKGMLGAYNLTLTYSFVSPRGLQIQDKTRVNRPDLRFNPPTIGMPIKVRCVNDSFYRLM